MILVALLIGTILIVAAVRNSQGALFAALGEDVPAFVVWAAAIFAVGAIGFVPGLKPVSRGLLILIITVLILRNYKQIFTGFEGAWKNPPPPSQATDNATTSAAPSGANGASHLPDILNMGGVADNIAGNFGTAF
jgi:hypothetical protein